MVQQEHTRTQMVLSYLARPMTNLTRTLTRNLLDLIVGVIAATVLGTLETSPDTVGLMSVHAADALSAKKSAVE
jgi:hypothetical protein